MNNTVSSTGLLVLDRSRPLRLFTLFILYVGQGLPLGLLYFAVPAWMAVNGASAGDIGTVATFTTLPWSLKLVNGFLMDRYTYLPMGRRRAWLISAQGAMIAALILAAVVAPGVKDVVFLAAVGFAINTATTFQDVAVDGLAVDIMTEDERARGAGMMFGGQSIGIAAATAMCGFAIRHGGATAAFLLVAALVAMLTVFIVAFRERAGERRLPWSAGTPSPRNLAIQLEAWWPLLKSTFSALTTRLSLLWLPVLLSRGLLYGTMTGATPLIGASRLGWDEGQIGSLTASAGLAGGILAMTFGGWLGDRLGARGASILWYGVQLAAVLAMWGLADRWGNPALFMAFVFGWITLDLLTTVATLPICMRLCHPGVAATQFAIYMAISNFGITGGAFLLGRAESLGGLSSIFLMVAAGTLLALGLLLTVAFPQGPVFSVEETELALMTGSAPARERESAAV